MNIESVAWIREFEVLNDGRVVVVEGVVEVSVRQLPIVSEGFGELVYDVEGVAGVCRKDAEVRGIDTIELGNSVSSQNAYGYGIVGNAIGFGWFVAQADVELEVAGVFSNLVDEFVESRVFWEFVVGSGDGFET